MRATWVAVVLAVATLPGCIGDACKLDGKTTSMQVFDVAPGAVITLALSGCSTCDHSQTRAIWDYAQGTTPTGNVEIVLSPQCPVRDTESIVPVNQGGGFADNNFRNCGDVIDIAGYVTNRTDATLTVVDATLRCATNE